MDIAGRLRELREWRNLSQGDIEQRTGLLRCYISRVENAHTVPSLETLEKISRALEVPLYQLFCDGERLKSATTSSRYEIVDWASRGKGQRMFNKFRNALMHLSDVDRALLLFTATKMAHVKQRKRT